MSFYCHHCGNEIAFTDRVGRGDTCPFCNSEAHCCLNCLYYDPSAYNECHETNADRVLEKDRANFCDYFSFAPDRRPSKVSSKDGALSKLDELFKKK